MTCTRVGGFCRAIVEAGWLTAALVGPPFFNIHSTRSFDLSKVLLSLLAGLAAAVLTYASGSWKRGGKTD